MWGDTFFCFRLALPRWLVTLTTVSTRALDAVASSDICPQPAGTLGKAAMSIGVRPIVVRPRDLMWQSLLRFLHEDTLQLFLWEAQQPKRILKKSGIGTACT